MAAALMLIGALLLVAGTALYDWKAAVIVGGAVVLLAGVDLARRPGSS